MKKITLIVLAFFCIAGTALAERQLVSNRALQTSDVVARKATKSEFQAQKAFNNAVAAEKVSQLAGKHAISARKADGSTSIEGTWTFSLGDYYFQTSVGSMTYDFEASLDGTDVWFEDPTDNELPFVGKYNATTGVITFSVTYLGSTGTYYINQEPFVYNWDTDDLDVKTITAQHSGNVITFAADNGISWVAYSNQALTTAEGYFSIYDLEGAVRAAEPEPIDEVQAGQWTSVGMATFVDAWILPSYTMSGAQINPNNYAYEVELQQNVANKNLYRLWKPYKTAGALVYDEGLNQSKYEGQIQFDITDPDHVVVGACGLPSGFKNNNGEFYLFNELGFYFNYLGVGNDISYLNTILDLLEGEDLSIATYKDGVVTIQSCVFDITSPYQSLYSWQNNTYTTAIITFPKEEVEEPQDGYVLSSLDLVAPEDAVILTWAGSDKVYAITNTNGTSSAPAAVEVTVTDNTIVNDNEQIVWQVSKTDDGYVIYPYGETEKWLYTTATNNGMRVGTNNNKYFNIDETTGYLTVSDGTNLRYVGIYDGQDVRGYTSVNSNIRDQVFNVYVKKAATVEPEPSFGDASIEGEWDFTLNWHYLGEYSLGQSTDTYIATLDGNTVTFADPYGHYDIVAVFTAENTLTFPEVAVGNPAMFTLTQSPFYNGSDATDIEDLYKATVTADYDPVAGTITFTANTGLRYGHFSADGELGYWDDAFDFITAKRPGESVEPEPTEVEINVDFVYAYYFNDEGKHEYQISYMQYTDNIIFVNFDTYTTKKDAISGEYSTEDGSIALNNNTFVYLVDDDIEVSIVSATQTITFVELDEENDNLGVYEMTFEAVANNGITYKGTTQILVNTLDGGNDDFIPMTGETGGTGTGVDNINRIVKARKVVENGNVVIVLENGKRFNLQGAQLQ